MPINFQGAPYPSDPARLTVPNTFSGQMQLAPAQAAIDANSAMNRGLADARYFEKTMMLRLTSDTSSGNNTLVNSVESIAIPAGTYMFDGVALCSTTSTTAGANFSFDSISGSTRNLISHYRLLSVGGPDLQVPQNVSAASRIGIPNDIFGNGAGGFLNPGASTLSCTARFNGIIIFTDPHTIVGRVNQRSASAATAMVSGRQYQIQTVETTDFTLVGSPNNTVGTTFTATGAGTGTGTVWDLSRPAILRAGSYIMFNRIA